MSNGVSLACFSAFANELNLKNMQFAVNPLVYLLPQNFVLNFRRAPKLRRGTKTDPASKLSFGILNGKKNSCALFAALIADETHL